MAQAASDPGVMWVQVLADGGLDQLFACDPHLGLRSGLNSAGQIAGGGEDARHEVIRYCTLDPQVATFFSANAPRMLVFNGIDTGTNNHEVGVRYSMSGSSNTGYPIFAAQVAAAFAEGRPMPLIDVSGYDETGGLLAPTRIGWQNLAALASLKQPNRYDYHYVASQNIGPGEFLPAQALASVRAAHAARLGRLAQALRLPDAAHGLAQLRAARGSTAALAELEDASGSGDADVIELGLRAFKRGLAVSLNCSMGGFDTHDGLGGDAAQRQRIVALVERVQLILDRATANAVPVVCVVCTDFGRSPNYDGGDGTDHWPNASMWVVKNALVTEQQLPLPMNRTIGLSSAGAIATALQPQPINPVSFAPDPSGVRLTPGHIYRALRRAARIDTAAVLSRFPLSISGPDLPF